jgi:transcriptional regulator with XRE-family HTH domain
MWNMTKHEQTEFARLIKARLHGQGLSQRQAAEKSDLSHTQLSRMLQRSNERLLHTELATLVAIARTLNIDLLTLLETFVPNDILRSDRDSIARSISVLPKERQKAVAELIRALANSQQVDETGEGG